MALSAPRRRILETLRDGPRQAHEVAHRLGVQPSSAYRQLVRLEADRLVASTDIVDGPGRPKRLYRLTPGGQEAFPRDYAFLVKALLHEIEHTGGRGALLRHLEGVAARLGAPLADERDRDGRLKRLLDLYNSLGFEASLERSDDALVLVQRNCPFLKTARQDPEGLCACLDEGIMRAALPDMDVALDASLARGDLRCRHIIRDRPSADLS